MGEKTGQGLLRPSMSSYKCQKDGHLRVGGSGDIRKTDFALVLRTLPCGHPSTKQECVDTQANTHHRWQKLTGKTWVALAVDGTLLFLQGQNPWRSRRWETLHLHL